MKSFDNPTAIAQKLTQWYENNARHLPFRTTGDSYKIFLSELMLQQTQVATMIPYYERFIERFPTIVDVAKASEEEILKYWEGLGYYSRARYVHKTATIVKEQYDGIFPSDLKTIESLKGIGRYTARAIHSIAFNQPSVAVDGNVMRVVSRLTLFDEDAKRTKSMRTVETSLQPLMNQSEPRIFTQAMMELGALVCKKDPLCETCPLSEHCFAYKQNRQSEFPVIQKAKAKTQETYDVYVLDYAGSYYMVKRPEKGLLAGMWEFPMIQSEQMLETLKRETNQTFEHTKFIGTVNHVFTHKIWTMHVYHVTLDQPINGMVNPYNFEGAISKAHKKIMELL